MNVVSLDLCRELYDLSDWNETEKWYGTGYGDEDWAVGIYDPNVPDCLPAYDLGYLLRKLPAVLMAAEKNACVIDCGFGRHPIRASASTPEDATAKLAIELFKHGILKRND
jgi:hypothetical protein